MDNIDYRGYDIFETPDGYFTVGDMEFVSLDDAMDWIDQDLEFDDTPIVESTIHTYVFFYVDRCTDQSYEVAIKSTNYKDAVRQLKQQYDVYSIADSYMVD